MSHTATPALIARSETRKIAPRSAEFAIRADTWSDQKRTVQGVLSTGAMGRRYDWNTDTVYDEELSMEEGAIRMGRLASGSAPVLDSHRSYTLGAVMGVVEGAAHRGAELVVDMRFADTPDVADNVRKVATGIVRNMSAGYRVHRYLVIPAESRTDGGMVPLYRAIDWEPFEASMVPIGFDAAATTRSADGKPNTPNPDADDSLFERNDCVFQWAAAPSPSITITETTRMADQATQGGTPQASPQPAAASAAATAQPTVDVAAVERAAEDKAAANAVEILDLCARAGMSDKAAEFIKSKKSLDQVRAAIFDAKFTADQSRGNQGPNVRVQTIRDETDVYARGLELALTHRVDPTVQLDDSARQFRGMNLIDIGRDCLERAGVNTRGMTRDQIARRMLHQRSPGMHTVSDFPAIMANVANKRMRSAYEQAPSTYQQWARRAPSLPDFKPVAVNQMGAAPELLPVNEHGEVTYGTMSDAAQTYQAIRYARIVSFTDFAIINDDMRQFDTLVTRYGNAAARLENRLVYGQLTSTANLADGQPLFVTTAAGNRLDVNASASLALTEPNLTTARTAMRRMKGLAPTREDLNIAPRFLIVPSELEIAAFKLTSPNYVPEAQSNISEFRTGGRAALEVVSDAVLTAAGTWYLAADSNQIDTIEYAYREGAEGPVISSDVGFEVEGVSYKCVLDFAAQAIDYRGLYRGVA